MRLNILLQILILLLNIFLFQMETLTAGDNLVLCNPPLYMAAYFGPIMQFLNAFWFRLFRKVLFFWHSFILALTAWQRF